MKYSVRFVNFPVTKHFLDKETALEFLKSCGFEATLIFDGLVIASKSLSGIKIHSP